MVGLADRFEAKVDHSGEHHLWTGAKKSDGTGLIKVAGRMTTARRVAWELAHGALPPGKEVASCPDEKACVRVDHLSVPGKAKPATGPRRRSTRGSGTKVQVRPGVWKLTANAGRYDDGRPRRVHKTVRAANEDEATREQIAFAAEVSASGHARTQAERDITVNQAVELYLAELSEEKGRERRTLRNYRGVHSRWFAPQIGEKRVRDVDDEDVVRVFGQMRRAGISRSRMQDGRNLYGPFFRWAKRRRLVRTNPMADFELPPSTHVAREHTPPEVEQLCAYLAAAVEVVPDVAPILTLAAVTGMRRGELVSIRRSRLYPEQHKVVIDAASDGRRIKQTKTRVEREIAVDPETMAMLTRHCACMDEVAAVGEVAVGVDAFVFSREPDCSLPMPADHVTKQVAVLKEHLGIANKRPETIALEDEALRLFRSKPEPRPDGKTGPRSRGGLSYEEIGRRLGRSTRWAFSAVASAQRREAADSRAAADMFDGSTIALRKFTSSELLDAGFNISMVAQRQGHSAQVLVKHYARFRPSADRKAAAHLGQVVHGAAPAVVPEDVAVDG